MSLREQAVQKITERLCVLFHKEPSEITEDTRFVEDLGAKSGNVSQLTNFLEDQFDVEVPFMKFRRCTTVGQAADLIVDLVDE